MALFDDFKQKTSEAAEVIADKSATLAKKVAGEAKNVMQIGRLKVDIAAERDSMRKNYIQLGKLCYETVKDAQNEDMAKLIAELSESEARIKTMLDEIEAIRGDDECADECGDCCDTDFEDVCCDGDCCHFGGNSAEEKQETKEERAE